MKQFLFSCLLIFAFTACNQVKKPTDLDNLSDPEEVINEIYPDFQLESLVKEDFNNDGYLDYSFQGYDVNGNWLEAFFIHNGGLEDTYTYLSGDEYWSSLMEEDEIYLSIEDYFIDTEGSSDIMQMASGDLNDDGFEDTIVIAYYNGDDYLSLDAYIFFGVEGGFDQHAMAEIFYPLEEKDKDVIQDIVIKDKFFTLELADPAAKWIRNITFQYNPSYGSFKLFKDGGKVFDENGNVTKEEVLSSEDFGDIFFEEFNPKLTGLFSINQIIRVSSVPEFLEALGNNRTIYLEEGIYVLNSLSAIPKEAQESFSKAKNGETFYNNEFYSYSCGWVEDSSEISLALQSLSNVNIIGLGDVKFVVNNEFISVILFEDCYNVQFENVYLVHDVGGVCGAGVVDLISSAKMYFKDCIFDGSGEIAVYAHNSYDLEFNSCYLTNCSSGAIEFYDSDAIFQFCQIEKNDIWYALVSAYSNSNLDFYDCNFTQNVPDKSPHPSGLRYVFFAKSASSIFVAEDCMIKDNGKIDLLSDPKLISIPAGIVF